VAVPMFQETKLSDCGSPARRTFRNQTVGKEVGLPIVQPMQQPQFPNPWRYNGGRRPADPPAHLGKGWLRHIPYDSAGTKEEEEPFRPGWRHMGVVFHDGLVSPLMVPEHGIPKQIACPSSLMAKVSGRWL